MQYMPFLWTVRSALCNQEGLFANSIAGTAVTVIPRLTRIGKTSYTIQNKARAPSAKLFVQLKGLVLMVVRNFACWYLPRRYLLFVIDLIHLSSGKWDLMPRPIMSHPNHPHIIKLRNYDRNTGYDVRDGASAGHRRDGHGTTGYFIGKSCPVDLPCHSGSGGNIDLITWFTCVE